MVLRTGSYARHALPEGPEGVTEREPDNYPSGSPGPWAATSLTQQPEAKAQRFVPAVYPYTDDRNADQVQIPLNQPEDRSPGQATVQRLGVSDPKGPRYIVATYNMIDADVYQSKAPYEVFGIDVAGIAKRPTSLQDVGGRSGSYFGPSKLVAHHVLEDRDPPFVQNRAPSSGTIEVPLGVVLQFQINDLGEGFNSGVDINTIHVRIAEVGQPFDDIIISGAFQAPFTGPSSSILPGGYFASGTYRGFDILADNTLLYVQEGDYLLSITASDIYGNVGFDEYPFKMEGGCPPFLAPQHNDFDYTIIAPALSLIEHDTRAGCQIQQAPMQFGVPGTMRLRNFGRAVYSNVSFERTYNQRNKTEHPLGLATTPETAITNHQLSVTVQNFVDEFDIIPRADGDALRITGNGVFTFPEVFQKGDSFDIQPVNRPDLTAISITGGVGVFNQVSESGTLINGYTDIRSMQFDGNHYLTIPSSSDFDFNNVQDGSEMTIVAWIKPDSLDSEVGIASRWNTKTGDAAFMFGLGPPNSVLQPFDALYLRVPTASVQQDGDVEPFEKANSGGGGASVVTSSWQQVACVWSGSAAGGQNFKVSLYHNATESAAIRVGNFNTEMQVSAEPIHIGLIYDVTSSTYQGGIGEIAFYNKSLTSAEINEIYNSGSVTRLNVLSTSGSLVAWYRMGDFINDNSASVIDVQNGNNAVISNPTGSGPFYIFDTPGNV